MAGKCITRNKTPPKAPRTRFQRAHLKGVSDTTIEKTMRNKISGAIGIVWGGLILANGFLSERAPGNEAYESGQSAGLALGALLLFVGLYYFFKKPSEPKS